MTVDSLIKTTTKDLRLFLHFWDNASSDGTSAYLNELSERQTQGKMPKNVQFVEAVFSPENKYPGYAYNHVWDAIMTEYEPDYLMASDNDILYKDGWFEAAERVMQAFPQIGQVGILNNLQFIEPMYREKALLIQEQNGVKVNCQFPNVAGTFLLRPEVFRRKARWPEGTWSQIQWPAYEFGKAVLKTKFGFCNVLDDVAVENVFDDYIENPDYYDKTFKERGAKGLLDNRREAHKQGLTKDGYVTR